MSDRNNKFENYYGSKGASGVYQQIINQIRPHDVYMELFAGTAVVFNSMKRSDTFVLNDIDPDVFVFLCKTLIGADPLRFSPDQPQDKEYKGHIINCDTWGYLRTFRPNPATKYCLYLDPPYPISSRKNAVEVYKFEMTDNDHRNLLEIVTEIGKLPNVDVLISTYKNPIYAEYLADWRLITFPARTRTYTATEYLYMNYPEPVELHDYRYIGKDFTDRQRIARKIDRKVKQLMSMPDLERKAIIHAIQNRL